MQLLKNLGTRLGKTGRRQSWALFKCPDDCCGKEVERQIGAGLIAKSCGSLECKENKGRYEHGESHTRLYNIWALIKQRILNSKATGYKTYGGRGITICNEWLEFIPFRDWSLFNGYTDNLEIDRKNIDGNYEPSNCNWVTHKENIRWRTTTKLTLELVNEIRYLYSTGEYTQKELAEKYNVANSLISQIINNKIWKK